MIEPPTDRTAPWLALQPPVWVPVLWWLTVVGTIVVSMAGDPGVVCTVAAPCTGDVAFSVAVTLAGVSVVGMWWMPLSALWAGVGFAVVSAGFDPSTPGRYAAVVAGFVAVALGAFVMALRGRQATVAQELLAVGVQPWAWSPVAAAVQPRSSQLRGAASARLWAIRGGGVLGALLLAGSMWFHARDVAQEQVHVERSHRTMAVVETYADDDFRQAFRVEDGAWAGRLVRIETTEELARGSRWPVLLDDLDPEWARLVSEPPGFTHWYGWGLLGLLVAVWVAGREARRLTVRAGGGASVGVLVHHSGDEAWLAVDNPSRQLAMVLVAGPPAQRSPAQPGVVHGRLASGSWVAVQVERGMLSVEGPVCAAERWRMPGFTSGAIGTVDPASVKARSAWNRALTVGKVLLRVGAVALGCGLVWLGVSEVPSSWAAAHGKGVPGTVVVTSESCGKSCDYYGDFTSDDGRFRFTDVNIVGDGGQVGTRLRAFHEGDSNPEEVYAPGWSGFVGSLFFVAVGLGLALPMVGELVGWRLRRRLPPGRHARPVL